MLPSVTYGKEEMKTHDSYKAGRPPKGKSKRSFKLTVSFNEDELLMMRHKARKTGMTPAAYCRRAAVRKQIAEALSEEDRKLLHSLWNIGNNLNQLVHNLHAFGRTAQERELRQMSREFSQVLAYFREVRDGR